MKNQHLLIRIKNCLKIEDKSFSNIIFFCACLCVCLYSYTHDNSKTETCINFLPESKWLYFHCYKNCLDFGLYTFIELPEEKCLYSEKKRIVIWRDFELLQLISWNFVFLLVFLAQTICELVTDKKTTQFLAMVAYKISSQIFSISQREAYPFLLKLD